MADIAEAMAEATVCYLSGGGAIRSTGGAGNTLKSPIRQEEK